ncbi:SDR family oxidoreductase [Muricoccus radiodurans]|uniref:SDR family oxidoreductase n=1 Tax=Muricoccus radiodurans TaxID=2231721 RepID=UPI003CF887D5
MAGRLQGKRAFVTAAGQGIGRATALAFAREGATVIATDLHAEKLDGLAGEGIGVMPLDVLDDAALTTAIQAAGPFDILFNCAGFVHQNTAETCTDEDWDFAFRLNVRATWKGIQAAIPGMLERGGGSIINMSSGAGSIKGAPNRFVYGTTKAAVIGITKSVAADYVAKGIRCNAICPGTVDTPSLGDRIAANATAAGGLDQARAAFVARQAMGRLGNAEEIAMLAVWLASDEAGFVTGQPIVIDGGWTL